MQESERLNEPQQRHLRVSCQYIDGLLCEMEEVFRQGASLSPFPRYVADLTPAQIGELERHIRRVRAELLRTLEWQEMKPSPPRIPATRAILTNLSFIDNAVEELKPNYMRGCGAVPESAMDGLNRVISDLRKATKEMERYMRRELTETDGDRQEEGGPSK